MFRNVVFLVLLAYAAAQTCSIETNTDYNNGYLVQLYQVKSSNDCCSACSTFEECTYFSYIKDPNAGDPWYQSCFVKNLGTNKVANNATDAGPLNRNPPPPYQCQQTLDNTDFDNGWLSLLENVPSANRCCELCANYPGCNYWSWMKDPAAGAWYQRCFFKATNSGQKVNNGTTCGASTAIKPATPRTGKRGLAWFNSKSCSDLKLMNNVSWIYNWGTQPSQELVPCLNQLGIAYAPMQWGGFSDPTDLNQTIWGNGKMLLGFNEPNFKTQSNVLPADAARMWPSMQQVAAQHNMPLFTPSASACGPNATTDCYGGVWSPIPWFDDFFANCTGCKFDALTTHIYTCDFNELTTYLEGLKKYNLPVWLTEFACPASGQPEQVEIDFMNQALQYLETQPYIGGYAWFGTRLDPTDGWLGPQVDLLAYDSAALTDLGKIYTTFKPTYTTTAYTTTAYTTTA